MVLINFLFKLIDMIAKSGDPNKTDHFDTNDLSKETERFNQSQPKEIVKQIRNLNLKRFEKTEHLPQKRNYSADLKKYVLLSVTPHVFIDSLMTVHLNCRNVSLCVSDQITLHSIKQIEIIAQEIKKDYNMYLDLLVVPLDTGCMLFLVFFKDVKLYNQLDYLQKYVEKISLRYKGDFSSILNDPLLVRKFGQYLGYPKCCIDFCVDARKNNQLIELETIKKLQLIGKTSGDIKGGIAAFHFDPISYFSFEFYPCDPYCKKAEKIGKNIRETFNKQDPLLAKAFKLINTLNIKRILAPDLTLQQNLLLRHTIDKMIYDIFFNI